MSPGRRPQAEVEALFIERWSPRAFLPDPVPREHLLSMFEAARWAPSCFNEQPWQFVWADSGPQLQAFRELLVDGNLVWAEHAPVVGFVAARRQFQRNGKANAWAEFDAGSAWMSFCLQASVLGYAAHGMGGFHKDRAPEVLGLDTEAWSVVAAFVVGRPGKSEQLPEELRSREAPSDRKPLDDVHHEGPVE